MDAKVILPGLGPASALFAMTCFIDLERQFDRLVWSLTVVGML